MYSSLLSFLALFLAITTASPLPTEPERRQVITCSRGVHIIHARGSTQTYEASSVNPVVNRILAGVPGSTAEQVQFPATIIADDSFYSTSVRAGIVDTIDKIERYVDACGDSSRIVLLGYSQGGNVVTSALAGGLVKWLPLNPKYRGKILAVASFGDPTHTKKKDYTFGSASGSGIFKRVWPSTTLLNTYNVRSYCLATDFFCDNGFSLQAHSAEMATYGPAAADWIIGLAR